MIKNVILILVCLVIVLLAIGFIFINPAETTLDILVYQFKDISVGLLSIVLLSLGMILGGLLSGAWYQIAKLKLKKRFK